MSEYSEGICGDGVAILKDGTMITPDEIAADLRRIQQLETLLALLDSDYETGRNPDPEDEKVVGVYRVTGSVNDREFTLVSTGRTAAEALAALLKENDK